MAYTELLNALNKTIQDFYEARGGKCNGMELLITLKYIEITTLCTLFDTRIALESAQLIDKYLNQKNTAEEPKANDKTVPD
jgi:hypothetical protein